MKATGHLAHLVSLISFLLSTALLGGGIWVATLTAATSGFLDFLQWPLLAIAGATSAVLLAAICFRSTFIVYLYTRAALFILPALIGLFVFGVATAVTDKALGRPVFNRAYQDYYLQDYSAWIEARMADPGYWAKASARVRDSGACGNIIRQLNGVTETADEFYKRNLSPIESGCCKPPTECGFTYVNETVWNAAAGVTTTNPDCSLWSNDQEQLCYVCSSCKAGIVATRRQCLIGVLALGCVLLSVLCMTYWVAVSALKRIKLIEMQDAEKTNGKEPLLKAALPSV